jgi:hypothetical protein
MLSLEGHDWTAPCRHRLAAPGSEVAAQIRGSLRLVPFPAGKLVNKPQLLQPLSNRGGQF